MATLCSGGLPTGHQCPKPTIWRNKYGVEVCEYHKLLLDAFTWEGRKERKWTLITSKPKGKEVKDESL